MQKFVITKEKNEHVLNARTDFLVTILELPRFLNRTLLL